MFTGEQTRQVGEPQAQSPPTSQFTVAKLHIVHVRLTCPTRFQARPVLLTMVTVIPSITPLSPLTKAPSAPDDLSF